MRELWECPSCGNLFVTPNMAHSCGVFSLDSLFVRSQPNVREAYDAFEAMARSLAEVRVIPQRTRVALQTRARFAGGVPKKDCFEAGFVFFRRHPSPRIHSIEDYGKWFGHRTRLYGPQDVDDEVRCWLLEALEYGDQRRLKPSGG